MTTSTPKYTPPEPPRRHEALSSRGRSRRAAWVRAGAVGVLLGVFYLYIRLRIGPHLLYHQQCPVFLTTFGFLKNLLGRPGGLLGYVSVFLAQFNYYPWIGAFVLTLTTSLICLSTGGLLSVMAGRRVPLPVVLLPAVGLLLLHNRYQYDPSTGTALLAALALANIYVRVVPRRTLPGLAMFLVSSFVVYVLCGSAYVLFAVLCGVYELVKKRRVLLGVFCLLCSVVPYGFSMYSYEVGPAAAYAPLLPFREGASVSFRGMLTLPRALHLALLLFFPVAAVATGLYGRRTTTTQVPVSDGSPPLDTPAPATVWMSALAGVFSVIAVVAVLWSFDEVTKTGLEISYCAQQGKWERVLEKARRLPPARWTHCDIHDVDRALYHTGRLLDEMFTCPQTKNADGLLLAYQGQAPRTGLAPLKGARLCFELGNVNRALGSAHGPLERVGEDPRFLKLMAKIYVVKGQVPMARTCLGALRKNLLYRNEAQDWLDRLEIDPDMTTDKELQRVRNVMLHTDPIVGSLDILEHGGMLQQLLRTNPRNRMAFEYAMAYYLWSRELGNLMANIDRLRDFDYSGLPRHCEEAVIVYLQASKERSVNLHGWRISDGTLRRARGFFEDLARYVVAGRLDRERAAEALAEAYGDSYLFYSVFGFSGSGARPAQADAVTGASK